MINADKGVDKKFLYLLGGITLVGFFLRLHGIDSESITADEVSALLRLKFSSFHAMIEGGVRPDGHPAFTQVLLWFWTKYFGLGEFSVRFPFVIFGTASIWLSGIIGRKWFSNTTGLATAIGIAFLQFPLMYSQLARPYAPGLFFTLLAVYFWTQFVNEKSKRKRDIIGFAFAAALAAYSHYFSLLTTTLIAIAGIFFVAKEIRVRYLIACVLAILLFLPHLSITLSQMKIGGVGGPEGWLGKPTPQFISDHLRFIFDGSRGIMWGVFLVSGFSALVFFKRPNKFQILSLLIWILPLLIGYIYSIEKNPVLQDSVLLFGFPFLLMFLFSRLPDFNLNKIAILFPVGFAILFFAYVTFYKPFHLTDHFGRLKELVATAVQMQEKYPAADVAVYFNVDAPYCLEYNELSLGKYPLNVLGTINNGGKALSEFRNIVENSDANFFVYGWSTRYSPLEMLPIIREKFPFLIEKKEWFNSAIYVFSKYENTIAVDEHKEIIFFSKDTFLTEGILGDWDSVNHSATVSGWSPPCKLVPSDTLGPKKRRVIRGGGWKDFLYQENYLRLDTVCIYSPSLTMKVGDILKNPDNEILFSTHIQMLDTNSNIVMVIEFERDGKQLYWNGRESADQIDHSDWKEWQHVYFGLQLPKNLRVTDTVKFYCYSKNEQPVLIDYLDVKTLKGHQGIYGSRADYQ